VKPGNILDMLKHLVEFGADCFPVFLQELSLGELSSMETYGGFLTKKREKPGKHQRDNRRFDEENQKQQERNAEDNGENNP
jgi:hypothetical protein